MLRTLRDIITERRDQLALTVVAACLSAASFSSYDTGIIAWFSLVPLFFALEGLNEKEAFLVSYLYGVIFFCLSMYWLIYVTPAGWVAVSLYQGLYIALFGLFFNAILTTYKLQITTYISIPSFWAVLEYLRSHIGGGSGWNLLGYSQYKNIPIIQIADVTGVYGVSFLIILVNLTLFLGIRMAIKCQLSSQNRLFVKSKMPFLKDIKDHPLFQTLTVFCAVAAVLIYGQSMIRSYNALIGNSFAESVKISVVQGNIPQLKKWDPAYRDYIMEQYQMLTLEAAKDKPTLIVWPETSIPGAMNQDESLHSYAQRVAKNAKTFLLTGSPMVNETGAGDYNSAVLFSKKADVVGRYDKLHLVPFGEFIPFEKYLPWLRSFFPITGAYIPGTTYTVFELLVPGGNLSSYKTGHEVHFSVLICFEDIFPDMVRHFVKDGADFMVNITNDAWFGRTAAAYQHTGNSVFRAVENRRPFVRSANTGLSCFIDVLGKVYSQVEVGGNELFISGYQTAKIKLIPSSIVSFYTRFGDIFIVACSLITGLFLIDYLRRGRYNN